MIKEIPGYPDYLADDDGNIYSMKPYRNFAPIPKEPRLVQIVIMGSKKRKFYRYVYIMQTGKVRTIKVSVLILLTFVSPRPVGMFACHGVNGSLDDSLKNLYWATPKQNTADRKRDGTYGAGENHHSHKLNESKVKQIRKLFQRRIVTYEMLANAFAVDKSTICDVVSRRSWKHV